MEKIIIFLFLLDAFASCLLYKKQRGKFYFVGALIGLGTAAYSLYKGHQQRKKARQLKNSNYVPPSVQEAVANSRMAASGTSPEYLRGQQKLRLSTQNTVNNARRVGGSAGQIQQAVADSDAREKEAVKDLEVSDAAYRNNNRLALNQQLGIQGQYEKESYDNYNAAKSALLGAAEQNTYNGITQGLEAGANLGADIADYTAAKKGGVDPSLMSIRQQPHTSVNTRTGVDTSALSATPKKPTIWTRPKSAQGAGIDTSQLTAEEWAELVKKVRLNKQSPGLQFANPYQ